MPVQTKRFYSVKEASNILGVSTNTVYKHLEEGKLKGKRIGKGRFKIPHSELAPYLASESQPVAQSVEPVKEVLQETLVQVREEIQDEIAQDGHLVFGLFIGLSVLGLGLVYMSPFLIPLGLLVSASTLFPQKLASVINFRGKGKEISVILRILSVLALLQVGYLVYLQKDFFGLIVIGTLGVALLLNYQNSVVKNFMLLTTALFVLLGAAGFAAVPQIRENWIVFIFIFIGLLVLPLSIVYGKDAVRNTKILSVLLPILGIATFGAGMYLLANAFYAGAFFSFFYAILGILVLWEISGGETRRLPKIAPTVLTWIALVILLGLFVVNVIQESIKESARQSMMDTLSLKAGEIDLYFEKLQSTVDSTISKSEGANSFDQAKSVYNIASGVSKVGVVDSSGMTTAIYPRKQKVVGEYVAPDSYLQRTKDTLRGYVTPYSSSPLNGNGVFVTQPTFIKNDIDNIFVVGIDLEDLSYRYQSSIDGASFYAIDENGTYVLNPNPELIGQKHSGTEEVVAVKQQAKNPRWTLYMELPKEELLKNISIISVMVSILIIVNSAFSLGVFLFLPRKNV